jgi:hypothetical protein
MRAVVVLTLSLGFSLPAAADATCPAATDQHPLFGTSIPEWYGTESLAVLLPSPAVWPTSRPDLGISGRVLWRSSGFLPGTEAELSVRVRSLDGAANTGRFSRATNAYPTTGFPLTTSEMRETINQTIRSPDAWRMLNSAVFPDPGCWEVTATYRGQTLMFVVETVNSDRDSADILSPVGGFNPPVIIAPTSIDGRRVDGRKILSRLRESSGSAPASSP